MQNIAKMDRTGMIRWHNRNHLLSPQDPDYDSDYDVEEDYEAYVTACEERAEFRREND